MSFKKATVNAGSVAATLSNYPTYVALDRVGIASLAEAQSSRWYTDVDKINEVAREVVSADEGHGKIPSLTTTTELYIDYDGIRSDYAVGATYGRNAVWSDYESVVHMQSDATDSTGNGDGTINGTTFSGVGQIGNGGVFDGSDYLNMGDKAVLTGLTAQMWAKKDSASGNQMLFHRGNSSGVNEAFYLFYLQSGNRMEATVKTNLTQVYYAAALPSSVTALRMYHFTFDMTNIRLYQNASLFGTSGTVAGTTINDTATQELFLGAFNGPSIYWDGDQDEFRLRDTALSQDWITTEYNNQNDEATFWGTWTDAAAGGGSSIKSIDGVLKANIKSFNGVELA